MQIIYYIKILNNTELGKTGTNDTYIRVADFKNEIENFFLSNSTNHNQIDFLKKNDPNKSFKLRLTTGKEHRVVGLGPFYREYNINAGDQIILEKHINHDSISYYINYMPNNALIFYPIKDLYEILNFEKTHCRVKKSFNKHIKSRINVQKVSYEGALLNLCIKYMGSKKKRADSQTSSKIYEVFIGNKKITNKKLMLYKPKMLNEIISLEKYYNFVF